MSNKPVPSALNKLRGNPGKRGENKREPKPTPGVPTQPEWLSTEAKREWTRVTKELNRIGLLSLADRAILAGYCQLWGKLVEGQQAGKALSVPELTQMRLYAVELGLTPSARVKLQVEPGTLPESSGATGDGKPNPFEGALQYNNQQN